MTPKRDDLAGQLRAWIKAQCDVLQCCNPPRATTTLQHPSWSNAELAGAVNKTRNHGTFLEAIDVLAKAGDVYRDEKKRWHPADSLFSMNGNTPEEDNE